MHTYFRTVMRHRLRHSVLCCVRPFLTHWILFDLLNASFGTARAYHHMNNWAAHSIDEGRPIEKGSAEGGFMYASTNKIATKYRELLQGLEQRSHERVNLALECRV